MAFRDNKRTVDIFALTSIWWWGSWFKILIWIHLYEKPLQHPPSKQTADLMTRISQNWIFNSRLGATQQHNIWNGKEMRFFAGFAKVRDGKKKQSAIRIHCIIGFFSSRANELQGPVGNFRDKKRNKVEQITLCELGLMFGKEPKQVSLFSRWMEHKKYLQFWPLSLSGYF